MPAFVSAALELEATAQRYGVPVWEVVEHAPAWLRSHTAIVDLARRVLRGERIGPPEPVREDVELGLGDLSKALGGGD